MRRKRESGEVIRSEAVRDIEDFVAQGNNEIELGEFIVGVEKKTVVMFGGEDQINAE